MEGHTFWVTVTLRKCVSFETLVIWPSTDHSDLSVDEQPHSKRSPLHSMNHGPHLGQTLVIFHLSGCMHTNQWPPYTHPPSQPGVCICSPLPGRTGAWSLFLLLTTTPKPLSIHKCTYPSNSDLSIFHPDFWAQYYKPSSSYPRSVIPQVLSLDSMPSPCTTLQQASHDVIGLISKVMYSTT